MFADVTGSTGLGEHLDPEALRRVMARYFEEMGAVLVHHGATVEKFTPHGSQSRDGLARADVLVQELDLEALLLRLELDDVPDRDDAHRPAAVGDR